jgi:D-alanyl-lipoteichoic acid acyltransferase DltB (MBOAT superfamily)
MLFNSFEFLFAFLPVVCIVYFLLGHGWGRLWLLLASFFFYGYWEIRYVPLLAASVLFNYFVGKRVRGSSAWLIFGVSGNVAALAYYKYTGFFLMSLNTAAGWQFTVPTILLPLGISFFTFTQIAYLIDASSEKIPEYNLVDYALFVSYFPHLLAGPILHHAQMMPQFANEARARFDWDRFSAGLSLLAAGLVKKILIADLVAPLATEGFRNPAALTFASAWIAALAYTAQIYFDFSGYTDMARGVSKMLNIDLPINFNSPYQARNLQDFWQRWHMTLSKFLRDYIFYAVGGAKRHLYFATIATFAIAGLWHGANWTFVIWGLLNGFGIVLVRLTPVTLPVWLARGLTFVCVTLLWVWFRAASVADAWAMWRVMLTGVPSVPVWQPVIALLGAALAFAWFAPNSQKLFDRPVLAPAWRVVLGLLTAYSIASLQNASEFLYFNF